MRVEQLPGQWVYVTKGSPMLLRSRGDGPATVRRDLVVRVERIEPPMATRPALAIWSDHEGEYGVDARLVVINVVSRQPSGEPIAKIADTIDRWSRRLRRRSWRGRRPGE